MNKVREGESSLTDDLSVHFGLRRGCQAREGKERESVKRRERNVPQLPRRAAAVARRTRQRQRTETSGVQNLSLALEARLFCAAHDVSGGRGCHRPAVSSSFSQPRLTAGHAHSYMSRKDESSTTLMSLSSSHSLHLTLSLSLPLSLSFYSSHFVSIVSPPLCNGSSAPIVLPLRCAARTVTLWSLSLTALSLSLCDFPPLLSSSSSSSSSCSPYSLPLHYAVRRSFVSSLFPISAEPPFISFAPWSLPFLTLSRRAGRKHERAAERRGRGALDRGAGEHAQESL